ncbi:MAG: hypothetical protein KBD51_00375 [Candidatus Levybacteria bacterium]|nr:hypothetical protein [Candidatus Levybacteria bacterium]
MAETNLAFSKVVATPTPTAWSQAYSAGRLFAALSLQTDAIPQEGEEHLNSLGKDLISTLESEFFTLEKKDLESIKQAVTTTAERVKDGVRLSFVICYLNENVLYLFATGGGKSILKRGEKIGTVLEAIEDNAIKSASGYVQEGDIIVLQTKSFTKIIPSSVLAQALDSDKPEEISENLAPHLHEKTEGAASAVVLLYKKMTAQELSQVGLEDSETEAIDENSDQAEVQDIPEKSIETQTEEKTDEAPTQETTNETLETQTEGLEKSETGFNESPEAKIGEEKPTQLETTETPSPFLTDQIPTRRRKMSMGANLGFLKKLPGNLGHSRKIILTIVIALIVVIVISGILALFNRQNKGTEEKFAGVFNVAQEKYDEGVSLKDLNSALAQESFREAKRILDENKDTFKEGSDEDDQIEKLLTKVNNEVGSSSEGGVNAPEVDKSESNLLSLEIDNEDGTHFTQNEDFVYFLDDSGANSIDKGNDTKEALFDKSWKNAGGIGVFGSNIYVLDKDTGISKFVPSEDDYTESDYLTEEVDLSDASGLAIDGSIYILFSNGSINKYTKGAEDDFEVSGIDKEMSSPTRIVTGEDFDNIYVLDNGNARVVVLDKTGKFVKSYQAGVAKNATDIDVDEANNAIFVLSNSKIFKIDIN